MSISEIVGLCGSIALLAGIAGAVVGVLLARGRSEVRVARREAFVSAARWVAARKSMSRAASSFVASFRALALEPPDSPNRSLREQEAQRCRASWCEACGELERVEAEWVVLHRLDTPLLDTSANVAMDASAIREAIEGDALALKAFATKLNETDQSTRSKAEEWTRSTAGRAPSLQRCVSSLAAAVDAFTLRLGRKP